MAPVRDYVDLPGLPKLGPGQQASETSQESSSATQFQDPALAKALSMLLGGQANEAAGSYMDFVKNPADNPIFKSALQLAPSEDAGRMNLADTFRAAGNTASSTFADKAIGLESEFMRNRQGLASDLLTQLFPQVTEALYRPMQQIPQLLDATKLAQSQSKGSSSSAGLANKPLTTGGAGPGYTGTSYEPGSPSQAPTMRFNYGVNTPAPGQRDY
jgi:hypothetical protein